MNVYTLNNYHDIEKLIEKSNHFADNISNDLPFNRIQLPLLWFKYFSSENGSDFGTNRGRNFFGSKSWLQNLSFIIVENNNELLGIAPLFISKAFIKGSKDPINILSLCPDSVLIFYQDLLIHPEHRGAIISKIFQHIVHLIQSKNSILFLGHIPEHTRIRHHAI